MSSGRSAISSSSRIPKRIRSFSRNGICPWYLHGRSSPNSPGSTRKKTFCPSPQTLEHGVFGTAKSLEIGSNKLIYGSSRTQQMHHHLCGLPWPVETPHDLKEKLQRIPHIVAYDVMPALLQVKTVARRLGMHQQHFVLAPVPRLNDFTLSIHRNGVGKRLPNAF